MRPFNFADVYNRPQDIIAPQTGNIHYQPPINFADYGLLPGVAQAVQTIAPTNFVQGQSYFTYDDLALANWFTTRVHLAPLGKA